VQLESELAGAAEAASAYGSVSAVLAAEPNPGERTYLIALGEEDARRWLVLDAQLAPAATRIAVEETARIVVLSELAGELAGGGQLDELRANLAQVRLTEQPPGIEKAEEAALELERVIGAPPFVASHDYLDRVGVAAEALERALSDYSAAFANAMVSSRGTVTAFVDEVVERHATPLR
jgi:hypothetical protein